MAGVLETDSICWGAGGDHAVRQATAQQRLMYPNPQAHLRKHHRAPPGPEAMAEGVFLVQLAKEEPDI